MGEVDELDTPEPGDSGDAVEEEDVPLDPAVMVSAVVLLEGASEAFEKRVRRCAPCRRWYCRHDVLPPLPSLAPQVLSLPEAAVAGTHNTADGFRRRTERWRAANRPDAPKNTCLFFEEKARMEVLEVRVDGGAVDDSVTVNTVIAPYVEVGGTAYNYHPTEEEVAAAEARARAKAVSAAPCPPPSLTPSHSNRCGCVPRQEEEAAAARQAAQKAYQAEEEERAKREAEEARECFPLRPRCSCGVTGVCAGACRRAGWRT